MRRLAFLLLGLSLAACATAGLGTQALPEAAPDQVAFVAAAAAGQRPESERKGLQGIEKRIAARDKAVCAAKPDPKVRGWTGRMALKDMESDGRYHVIIRIGPDVSVSATGPLAHDPNSGGPATPERRRTEAALVAAVQPLREGQAVTFSGRLWHGSLSRCPRPGNLLIAHRLDSPTYTIMLDSIAPL